MTKFSDSLQGYLNESGHTASELADTAGLQRASVSRYLSGKRVPPASSDVPEKLALALSSLTDGKIDKIEAEQVLSGSLTADDGFPQFPDRLATVLDTYGIARNRLARSMDFDPSYISRILSGQRRPSDMRAFVEGVADYIARNFNDSHGVALTADLTGCSAETLSSPRDIAHAIRHYLGSEDLETVNHAQGVNAFLFKLDSFNLNDFLKKVKFDEIRIPTAPFQLPTSKTYEGIEEMKKAELDFLKSAVLSKSCDDVILYSDMPLGEMAEDVEFTKKVMTGIALLVKKGVYLRNIHDVHRPLEELFMGLEGWLPLYMTGQMSSHYLPHSTNDAFLHFIRSAGTVAVNGEAIAGNQGGGRYTLTKSPSDVSYVRRRAKELLALSKPLLTSYRQDEARKLDTALARLSKKTDSAPMSVGHGTFENMTITVWPNSHALIQKGGDPSMSFLIEHPALVGALERFEPTLFASDLN